MKNIVCLLVLLEVIVASESLGSDVFLNRWRRQAVHCQPGDEACQKCSSSCSTVGESHLPECCEAYNACCDEYFQACKQCSGLVSKDQFFPEYCCASFTKCCDIITTFPTQVKPPAPVRTKPKLDLKIPEVAAPKPSAFPGAKPVSLGIEAAASTSVKNTFRNAENEKQTFAPQEPLPFDLEDSVFAPKTPAIRPQEPRQQKPSFDVQSTKGAAGFKPVDNSDRQRTRTQARAQGRPQSRGRQQTNRRPTQDGVDRANRRGRVTARGRVID